MYIIMSQACYFPPENIINFVSKEAIRCIDIIWALMWVRPGSRESW